jgi:hypothetical protein
MVQSSIPLQVEWSECLQKLMKEKPDDMLKYNLTYITNIEQTAIISLYSINWLVL